MIFRGALGGDISNGIPTKFLTTEEFSALSEEEKMADVLYIVDEPSVSLPSGGGGTEEAYSEEETRIGTWFGKPLYRKCFNTKTPNSTGEAVPLVQLPVNVSKIINLYGQFESSGQFLSLNYYGNSSYYVTTYVNYSMGYVVMNISHATYTNCPMIFVLEYTKTTDEGGE